MGATQSLFWSRSGRITGDDRPLDGIRRAAETTVARGHRAPGAPSVAPRGDCRRGRRGSRPDSRPPRLPGRDFTEMEMAGLRLSLSCGTPDHPQPGPRPSSILDATVITKTADHHLSEHRLQRSKPILPLFHTKRASRMGSQLSAPNTILEEVNEMNENDRAGRSGDRDANADHGA